MFYLFLMVVLLVASGLTFYFGKKIKSVPKTESIRGRESIVDNVKIGYSLQIVCFACICTLIVLTLIAVINQIPAGKVGIVYQFGKIIDQVPEGLQFTPPWTNVKEANTQIISHKFQKLASFSQETQEVLVDATLNINVSPKDIQNLYRTVGPNFFDVLISPRVEQTFKDETVKYRSIDIAPNREAIRKTVRERLAKELTQYSITVTDLLLENIDFLPGFKQAIEDKQKATQNALKEEQNVKAKKFVADQAVEEAKGRAQSVWIEAEKQAQANKALAASITPELTQYMLVRHLSPKIDVMILPAGQNFILSSDMLKKKEVVAK
jgi:regulator of protease activity HflC (stomatin/prohibitin superfamily)